MIESHTRRWEVTVQWREYIATASSASQDIAKSQAFEYAFKQGKRRNHFYKETDRCFVLRIARSGIGNPHGRKFSLHQCINRQAHENHI